MTFSNSQISVYGPHSVYYGCGSTSIILYYYIRKLYYNRQVCYLSRQYSRSNFAFHSPFSGYKYILYSFSPGRSSIVFMILDKITYPHTLYVYTYYMYQSHNTDQSHPRDYARIYCDRSATKIIPTKRSKTRGGVLSPPPPPTVVENTLSRFRICHEWIRRDLYRI